MTALIVLFGGVTEIMLIILLLSSAFTLFVNGEIMLTILKGRKSYLGAYIAHIGIAVFLIGVVASGGYSDHKQVDLVKGEKLSVFGYDLAFTGYEPIDNGKKYAFNVEITKNGSTKVAKPVMFIAEFNNSLMREPDILVGFTKDFYVAPVGYSEGEDTGHNHGNTVSLSKGNTTEYNGIKITFESFEMPKDAMSSMSSGGEFKIGAILKVVADGKEYTVKPRLVIQGEGRKSEAAELKDKNLRFEIVNMNAGSGMVELEITNLNETTESKNAEVQKEVLTVEASIKPYISLVWFGVIFMVIGFTVAVYRRTKESVV